MASRFTMGIQRWIRAVLGSFSYTARGYSVVVDTRLP
jgi:hypothetical protein